MIIKGQAVKGAKRLANHLLKDENEQVQILEISGTASDNDLQAALQDMELVGELTKSRTGKVLYHANIDPRKNEALTPDQYIKAADLLMDKLGFKGQPRAIVQHTKMGRQHAHLVVQLTDIENGRLKKVSYNYYKHKEVARQLEKIFELEQTNERKSGNSYSQKEAQQIKKLQLSPKDFKSFLRGRYLMSQSGKEFQERIALEGFTLAQGKRIVVLDHNGNALSLSRQLGTIATAKQVKEKLKDVIEDLPTIEGAQLKIRKERNSQELEASSDNMNRKINRYKNNRDFNKRQELFDQRLIYYKEKFREDRER